jgi:hypothetical protein
MKIVINENKKMKRFAKISLLIILFAVNYLIEHPLIVKENKEVKNPFANHQNVIIVGDTGSFQFELTWSKNQIQLRTIVPSQWKQDLVNA